MLFEIKDNNIFDTNLDYFNINKLDLDYYDNKNDIKRNDIDLQNGFYLGNIFTDTYKPYKNYKPKRINAYSEQQKLLLAIQEMDFIINDLNLYLDINPNDTKMYELFKKYCLELDKLKKVYYEKYQVLELCKDTKGKYTWISNPWPWDGGYYV